MICRLLKSLVIYSLNFGNERSNNMSCINKYHYWCQAVLPSVYGNSLSYYEMLCKLAKGLELLDENNVEISNEIKELKEYVDNYFKTVNIDAEIKENLENMGESGQLQKFLNAYMLYGKKCVFLGDSLFWGDKGDSGHSAVDIPIPDYIQTITGCNAVSYARKSATMSTYLETNSNTLKNQLETGNLTNADYVFIEFFTNDMSKGVPFGSIDSNDWNTFCGALNNAINYINGVAPEATILVMGITPSNRYFNKTLNIYRTVIDSYNECLIKVCKRMNVKYVNLLNCGINRSNFSTFSSDGTHFNQNGYNKLALCILQNLGGNDVPIDVGRNMFNQYMYPTYDIENNYPVRINGAETTYTTYDNVDVAPGLYRIRFKYKCQCGVYDTQNYWLGIHIRIGGAFFISPIGVLNGTGEIDIITNLTEPLSGLLTLRTTFNAPDLTVEQLTVSDFEVIPITGEITVPIQYNASNNIDGYYNGYVKIRRDKGGGIEVQGVGTALQDIPQYTPFIASSSLRHIINIENVVYFTIFNGTNPSRGQLTKSGIACPNIINSGSTISFSFSF